MIALYALASLLAVSASPLLPRENASATTTTTSGQPKVTIIPAGTGGEGVVLYGRSNGPIDSYYGIPFAAPPVDDLRFAPPEDPTWSSRAFNATRPPPACLQRNNTMYAGYGYSEDCLYLNVQVPKGYNEQSAPLPVMLWVYGGGFTSGTSSIYDGSIIISQGIQTSRPVIYVSVNYRLGAFGFLNGQQSADNNAANLGLKDVQKSLEWVQQNIWAFGGDPDQVTAFGQSAGSVLISLLYLQPELRLFRSAILESGAQSTIPIGPTDEIWQEPYDLLVQYAGCNSSNSSTDSFDCLKSLPAAQLLAAQERVRTVPIYSFAFVFSPSVDGDLVPDSPHALLSRGEFAKIPFIAGNVLDEGTIFLPSFIDYNNLTLVGGALNLIEPGGLPIPVITELLTSVYPNDPAQGSPYNTGNETFGLGPRYKQVASIFGDIAFQAPRRYLLEQASAYGLGQSWNYLWTSARDFPPRVGVPHAAEVYYVFGVPQLAVSNTTVSGGIGAVAQGSNYTAEDAQLSQQAIDYWLNFAHFTDPNGQGGKTATELPYWPAYNGEEVNQLVFARGNTTLGKDDYRQEQMRYPLDRPDTFNYKRGEV